MNKNYKLALSKTFKIFICTFSAILLFNPSAYAHRGPISEYDMCNLRIAGERIHFTAYTPNVTGSTEYCSAIPSIGKTNLVFDYSGKKLRHISVEFEVTKEPEGTRVFHQESKKFKTGNMNTVVDFSKYGEGDYLIHITLMSAGEKIDSHIPLAVGREPETQINYGKVLLISVIVFITLLFLVTLYRAKKDNGET